MPKYKIEAMCSFLRIDISNFYQVISGITVLSVNNQKILFIEFFLGRWMQKSVWEYLAF
jgi:hypothetical protein